MDHNKTNNQPKKQSVFFKSLIFFFVPIVLFYFLVEFALWQVPQSYTYKGQYIKEQAATIELLALGSSQMQNAINPEYLSIPSINLGSTSQHHRIDFEILKQKRKQFPNLKTVVLELSTNHLQLPHNGKTYWKNPVYLKYYGVNTFERKTYFKDKLLYIARPDYFQDLLINHYITKKDTTKYNYYGFAINKMDGIFNALNYNDEKINKKVRIDIGTKVNKKLATYNAAYFEKIVAYCASQDLQVIICTIPMHRTFFKSRDKELGIKRDSLLHALSHSYKNVFIFNKEEDTLHFNTRDYLNTNHLNANGGKKFSMLLNAYLKETPSM